MDKPTDPSEKLMVSMTPIYLGDLEILCPFCQCMTNHVFVGMTTLEEEIEEDETPLDEIRNMEQMGVIAYPCGDHVVTPCLAEKVALILNGHDDGSLKLSMLHNLVECKEHGVEFPGQS